MTATAAGREAPVETLDRLAMLSDAVFAFAATLLAARLVVPAVGAEDELGEALADRVSTMVIYVFGFLVIGYQWWRHHRIFLHLERSDPTLVTLNLALLAFVAVMPYPTSVLGESQVELAVVMFVVPLLGSSVMLLALWHHGRRAGLLATEAGSDLDTYVRGQLLVLPGVLVVSLAVLALSVGASFAVWVALPLALYVFHRRSPDPESSVPERRAGARLERATDEGLARLVAFGDGLYAVVLTILVEQLDGPERRPGAELTNAELWENLQDQTTLFIAYVLAFYTVGLFFTINVRIFERVVRLTSVLLWLTLVHLMVVALQPFGLSLFSDFGFFGDVGATVSYLVVMLAVSLSLSAISIYVDARRRCVAASMSMQSQRLHLGECITATCIFVLAIGLTMVPGMPAGLPFAAFVLFPLSDWMLERMFPGADP